jgi:hypothetical protein
VTDWESKSDAELDEAAARAQGWTRWAVRSDGAVVWSYAGRAKIYRPTSDWRDCGPLLRFLRSGVWTNTDNDDALRRAIVIAYLMCMEERTDD